MSHDSMDSSRVAIQPGFVFAMVPEELIYDDSVSAQAKVVWMAYCRHADGQHTTFVGQRTLAEKLGVSQDTIQRRTTELVKVGWLDSQPWYRDDGSRGANTTVVIFDRTRPHTTSDVTAPDPQPSRTDAVARTRARELEPENERSSGPNSTPPAVEMESEPSRAAQPSLLNDEPPASASQERDAVLAEGFARFWEQYPRRDGKRVGRQQAWHLWRKLSLADRELAMRGVRHYAASGWKPKDAHRWLRDRCWEDWQEPARPSGNGREVPEGDHVMHGYYDHPNCMGKSEW